MTECREANLWCSVINQAIEDAISPSKRDISIQYRDDARRWLTKPSRQFRYVCDLAGFNSDQVRAKAIAAIAEADANQEREAVNG